MRLLLSIPHLKDVSQSNDIFLNGIESVCPQFNDIKSNDTVFELAGTGMIGDRLSATVYED